MPRSLQLLKTAVQLKEIIFAAIVLISFILGTWLTLNLIPLNKSINSLNFRVEATEDVDKQFQTDINDLKIDLVTIKEDTAYIRGIIDSTK